MYLPDWQDNFLGYILGLEFADPAPTFQWDNTNPQTLDCVRLVSGGILAISGVDPISLGLSGATYTNQEQGLALIAGTGATDLESLYDQYLDERPQAFMRMGDTLLLQAPFADPVLKYASGLLAPPWVYVCGPQGLAKYGIDEFPVYKAYDSGSAGKKG